MQYNSKKYVNLAGINEINYYLQWNLKIFKIKPSKASCLNAIRWEEIYKSNKKQWNKLLLTIEFQKHSETCQEKLSVLVQYNENENITLARTNELKYCLKLYFRSLQK